MREIIHRFWSTHLRNERVLWIREPADRSRPCALAVFLDAELYRPRVGAGAILDKLHSARALPNTLVVYVSYQSEAARWRECPCHPPFADMIADELLPWIEQRYPQTKKSRRRALIGLSYTGLAAAFVPFHRPGTFTHVVAQSGSFWWSGCHLVKQFKKLRRPLPTAFYLDVGRKETQVDLQHTDDLRQEVSQLDAVRRFRDVLKKTGHDVRHVEFDGGHHFKSWKETLPAALTWALR